MQVKWYKYILLGVLFFFCCLIMVKKKTPKHINLSVFTGNVSNTSYNNYINGITYTNAQVNYKKENYYKELIYRGDINAIAKINLTIGNNDYTIAKETLQKNIQITGTDTVYSITKHLQIPKTNLPYVNKLINWEGIPAFIYKVLLSPISILLFLAFFLYAFREKYKIEIPEVTISSTKFKKTIWLYAFAIFLIAFKLLIGNNFYFFLQDDNYIQFNPVITQNLIDLYENGNLPTYNFYQNAGLPTIGYSIYSLSYIGTHIAFIIAHYIFQDANLFCTVFAFLHFILGYYFILKVLEKIGVEPYIAIITAVAFIFCGFNIVASRSWYYIAPSVLYIPLLTYYRLTIRTYDLKFKPIAFCLLWGLYAYSGNFQMWIYALFIWLSLEILIPLFSNKKINYTFLTITLLLSGIIFLPQLLMTSYEINGLQRSGNIGLDISNGLNDFFHPFSGNNALVGEWNDSIYNKNNWVFYKSNFVLASYPFLLLFYSFFNFTKKKSTAIFICLTLCLLYSLGSIGVLAKITEKLPILKQFNHPFKLLIFIHFIILLMGAFFLQKLPYKKIIYTLLFTSFIGNLYQIVNSTKASFFYYPYKTPYTNLPYKNILDSNLDYRILPLSAYRSYDENYATTISHNLATVYRIPSLEALEVMNPTYINVKKDYSAFSVRYIVVTKNETDSIERFASNGKIYELKDAEQLVKIYEKENVTIYENKNYTPLITIEQQNQKSIAKPTITYFTGKVLINYKENINSSTFLLTLNYRKNLKVYCDGVLQKCTPDSLNRTVVHTKNNFTQIEIKYTY